MLKVRSCAGGFLGGLAALRIATALQKDPYDPITGSYASMGVTVWHCMGWCTASLRACLMCCIRLHPSLRSPTSAVASRRCKRALR